MNPIFLTLEQVERIHREQLAAFGGADGVREIERSGALLCGRSVGVALVRMHTFQVGKHYLAVEDVRVLTASVFDHSIRDSSLAFPSELGCATRTLLSEVHSGEVYEGRVQAVRTREVRTRSFASVTGGAGLESRVDHAIRPAGRTVVPRVPGFRRR